MILEILANFLLAFSQFLEVKKPILEGSIFKLCSYPKMKNNPE